jgi:hypothetical protein
LLTPLTNALVRVHAHDAHSRVLSMTDIIALGVLCHLQGVATLREQVRSPVADPLLQLVPATALPAPASLRG